MDRLHDESVRFLDFHVSPTCAPTRSALNRRHEFRNGVTHTIFERERLTLKHDDCAGAQARRLCDGASSEVASRRRAGYQPNRRGFDEVFVHGARRYWPNLSRHLRRRAGNTYSTRRSCTMASSKKTRGYCTDVFFGQAMKWMQSVRSKQPFFAYIPLNAPHTPLQVRPRTKRANSARCRPTRQSFSE